MNATTQQNNSSDLKGIQFLKGYPTINGQIKARENALKSCVKGRTDLSEGIPARLFDGWIKSHKETLRELYFRRAVLSK